MREVGIHEDGRRCQAGLIFKGVFKGRWWWGGQVLIMGLLLCVQGRRRRKRRRVWFKGCKFLGLRRSNRRGRRARVPSVPAIKV